MIETNKLNVSKTLTKNEENESKNKRRRKPILVLERRSLDSLPTHCLHLIPLLLLSSSSMKFCRGVFMSFESWNSPLVASKVIHFKGKIAAQTEEKPHEKTKSREKTEQPEGIWCCHGHGSHHGPWWPFAAMVSISRSAAFWCIFLARGSCHGSPVLGHF